MLHLPKGRKEHQLFIAEGEKTCLAMLRADRFEPVQIFITHDYHYEGMLFHNLITTISAKDMSRLSQLKTPSGILVVFKMHTKPIVALATNEKILYLDNVQDPGNVGTIIRIADWFGIGSLVRSADSADFYNPKVVQAAMGSLSNVSLFDGDLESISKGRIVYGTFMDGSPLKSVEWHQNGVLVLGSEGRGISPHNLSMIHQKVAIPGVASRLADSLNVSVAAGIICAEWAAV